jgi:hypothetical protein
VPALFLAALVGVASAPTAQADCDFPILPIRLVLPKADTIFIGDVTSVADPRADGFGYRFTVLVGYVLRGRVHRWPMKIRDLSASNCASFLSAKRGQRIVLALHNTSAIPGWVTGRQDDPLSSIGYITDGGPADLGPDFEIAASDVYRLAGVAMPTSDVGPPETDTVAPEPGRAPVSLQAAVDLAAGVALLVLAHWIIRRRPGAPSRPESPIGPRSVSGCDRGPWNQAR